MVLFANVTKAAVAVVVAAEVEGAVKFRLFCVVGLEACDGNGTRTHI